MLRRLRSRPVLLIALVLVALTGFVLDLFVGSVSDWFGRHQFVTAMLAEGILLAAVYIGFDYLAGQAEARRWRTAAAEPLRVIANRAELMDDLIEGLISEDRRHLDRSGKGYRAAKATYAQFKDHVDRNQALLTASPYMVEFLPPCVHLETYVRYLLASRAPGAEDDGLHIEWYDAAVWRFIAKFVQAVPITEMSEPWLWRVPDSAYARQLPLADGDDREFLRTYRRAAREMALSPPGPLPGHK